MPLRKSLRDAAEAEIAAEASKDSEAIGSSCVVRNLFNAAGSIRGYQITVKTSNGFSKTFAPVETDSEPNGLALVAEYQGELIAEIRRRRASRKAKP